MTAYRAPADEDKHFNFLSPAEVLALLRKQEIPLGRRVLYLLANYFGWRKGTLYAFKWGRRRRCPGRLVSTWARRAGKDDAWTKQRTGHTATSKMLDRYTRMAVTLADLNYQPFPDVTEALPELAEAARLHTRLHNPASSRDSGEVPEAPQPRGIPGCEGRDLNPHASYGASTSS